MEKNISPSDRIIAALDVSSGKTLRGVVEALGDSINFYKTGKELFVSEGPSVIAYLKEMGKKVFLDLKFHDIPNTVSKAAASLVRQGVDMFTVHASGGRYMMEATAGIINDEAARLGVKRPLLLAVTVLTSFSHDDLLQTGVDSTISDQVKRLALLAKVSGADGIVASPLEIDMLRKEVGDDTIIVTPGIRPIFASGKDDQKRVMTPKEAVKGGADYLVIGRPILGALDPKAAALEIIREISEQ